MQKRFYTVQLCLSLSLSFTVLFFYVSFKYALRRDVCRRQSLRDITTRWQWKTVHAVQAGPCGTQIKKITVKAPLRSTPRHPFPSGKRSTLTLDLTFFVGDYPAAVKAVASVGGSPPAEKKKKKKLVRERKVFLL